MTGRRMTRRTPSPTYPILDWESGTCRSVRDDVLLGFEDIAVRLTPRLERRLRHQVTALTAVTDGYQIDFTDLNAPTPASGKEPHEQFHMVFLAVGFGLEPREPVQGIQSASYWSDAGVPVAEFEGRPTPRFFISGAGDGGLIDFVAAGARSFDHAGMIRLISEHPGVAGLKPILAAIDVRARAEDAKGARFDFMAAYDAELLQPLTDIGLVAAVGQQLRPGVRLTFQTQHAELFDVSTATLNRLAAYLTIKACEGDAQRSFRHIQCGVVTRINAPDLAAEVADFWLDCAGETIAADAVIVRRGPRRDVVRRPFADHLASYDSAHKEWLARHGEATLVPKLSSQSRGLFKEAARKADIPLAPRLQRLAAHQLPIPVQLLRQGDRVRWSGAVPVPVRFRQNSLSSHGASTSHLRSSFLTDHWRSGLSPAPCCALPAIVTIAGFVPRQAFGPSISEHSVASRPMPKVWICRQFRAAIRAALRRTQWSSRLLSLPDGSTDPSMHGCSNS